MPWRLRWWRGRVDLRGRQRTGQRMGKGSKATVGYWYKVAYHSGLTAGPIDAFLEFRGGDKVAWTGNLTGSGTITINALNLWGGEKDQGGISGDVDVMFGEATQEPNGYLLATFGNQVPAWRGIATLVFKGGRYGAMNPYPQKPSYKFQRILAGWDDECWYPETAVVAVSNNAAQSLGPTSNGWRYNVAAGNESWASPTFDDSLWPIGASPFASDNYASHPYVAAGGYPVAQGTSWPVNSTIWVRRTFYVDTPSAFDMEVFVDNYATCWVNGHQVLPRSGGNAFPSVDAFKHAFTVPASVLVAGNNMFVMKAEDVGGWAYAALKVTLGGVTLNAMNPAHILYDARTQQDMGREPTANMNDASFRAAADWYFAQSFGLCVEYDPGSETLDDFISRVERVAGCSMSRSPVDGQWYLDIANGVYDLSTLPILSDDDILDFAESPTIMDSAANSVGVEYFDPQLKATLSTAPVQAMGAIEAFGTIHQQTTYLEIPTSDLAVRVATRDLRAAITPSRTFDLTTTRSPYSWRVGTYFRLQSPKRGIADMVCLLAEKSSGSLKSGAIKITASQDIYSLPTAAFVDAEHGVDTRPSQIPASIVAQAAVEVPYVVVVGALSRADLSALPDDAGYLMTMAADPSTSVGYTVTVSSGGDYAPTANGDWCACGAVSGAAGYSDSSFTLANAHQLGSVAVGMGALWGTEIVRVDAIDPGAGTIVLARGCADTVPVRHADGELVWFYGTDAAEDPTEYTSGETISIKLLTNTGSQELDPSAAVPLSVTFRGRQFRPYPPGQVRLNGGSAYGSPAITGRISLTWAHRNRVLQANQLVDTTAGGITPESGQTYNVRLYGADGITLLTTYNGIDGAAISFTPPSAGSYVLELESVRDGLASFQKHVIPFSISALDVSHYLVESGTGYYLTEDGTGHYITE